jgi:Ni/Fe-hydrogenase 1 B-type cytochrome subunit
MMSTTQSELRFPAYIWQAPVRIWHWIMALCMVVLWVTGYFIGSPLPSVGGEAVEHFSMGYIRFAHFAAGWVFALMFLFRVYWAFVGNKYSREIFLVPVSMLSASWWRGFFRVVAHYLFILRKPDKHYGHNQLAMVAMFAMFVLGSVFMIVTGLALYGEALGRGSWVNIAFTSWVIPLFGQSQDVHTWHHYCAWYLFWFAMVHLYFAIREDITSGLTVVSSMVNGWRDLKN